MQSNQENMREASRHFRLTSKLAITVLAVVGGMTALEGVKYLALPPLTLLESEAVTITFIAVASLWVAYFALSRESALAEQGAGEAIARKEAEAELRKTKEAAAAALRERVEFLAEMSQEIRTPLNGIVGMTDLALVTPLTAEQRDCLEMVKTSADSLSTVISDVLDYFKIDTGSLDIERIEFNLSDCLGDTLHTLALWANQKSLELACHIRHDVPKSVMGDPTRLRQIILNLVGNAIKFTEQGEIVLEVMLESETPDSLSLHFELRDSGIAVEKQGLIFKARTEQDRFKARQYHGAGVGVTVSALLIEALGGRVWVESQASRGSALHFTVPFSPRKSPIKPAAQEARKLRGMDVLVVDDSATNRCILEDLLVRWEMKPVQADGGVAALAALEQACNIGKPFPLVIVDAHMPDMDGFALAQRIKQSPQLAKSIVMLLAAHNQQQDAARSRELGITTFLLTPIKQSDVLPVILNALHRAEQPAPPTGPSAGEAQSKLRILLAEDNLVNQKLVVRWLERAGHTVIVAGNGREALAALEKVAPGKFDLVLMDVKMPEMDGIEATVAIREKERLNGRHLPIIALTAQAMKGDRERCLAAGMDAYISKPVRIQTLFETVERFVPHSARPSESPDENREDVAAQGSPITRLEGDKRLLADMMKLVRHESRKLLSAMREAIHRQDARALEDATRTLEISLNNLTAPVATERSRELEKLGGSADLGLAEEAYLGLEEEFERVRQALVDLVKGVAH